jgi:hypothetical protein
MKLIFHHRLTETDWFTFLLSDVVDEVVVDTEYSLTDGPAIHVVSANEVPLRSRSGYFERCRANSDDLTLLHASDEWYAGDYREYRHFDRVIRNHRTWLVRGPGICSIPVGYPNGLAGPDRLTPANERKYLWSFKGEVKASRIEMVEALRGVEPCFVRDSKDGPWLTADEYRALLLDSVFLPCPMGNVVAETWRLYEALEFGCIPIVEKRLFIDYYRGLLGAEPFLRVGKWREAGPLMRELVAAPDELLRLQRTTVAWWAETKERVKREVTAFMRGSSHSADLIAFSRRPRIRIPEVHACLRLVELLRHQNAGSVARRLAQPGRILAGIKRDRGRGPR